MVLVVVVIFRPEPVLSIPYAAIKLALRDWAHQPADTQYCLLTNKNNDQSTNADVKRMRELLLLNHSDLSLACLWAMQL